LRLPSPTLLRRPIALAMLALAILSGVAATGVAVAQSAPGANLLKVRVGGDSHAARVVIELDKTASGKLVSLADASKHVILALPHVEIAGEMNGQGEGLVKSWSVDSAAGAARIKFELRRDAVVKRRFLLPPGDGLNVYRYVVDLDSNDATPPTPAEKAAETKTILAKTAAISDNPQAPLPPQGKKVVVIDAGHGGKDSGALGAATKEKDDTLAAAHALRDRLERSGRYKVVMTRDTDAYIPLETRVQIARRANADLFISLHADSAGSQGSETRGASVYTLSERGTDRTAKGLFGKSDWFMNVNLPGDDSATKRILLDLTQRQNVNRSSAFAEILLDKIGSATTLLRRSHRDANLMVLLAPDVPAVLMEMGFMTNPDDEHALADADHREKVMDAVGDAIDAYFAQEARYAMR
jgi:N-acetylmuramoyl-L-alanine amidase